jgi:hypothetical protein
MYNALDYGIFKCYYIYSSYSYNNSDSAIVKIILFFVQPLGWYQGLSILFLKQ